MAPPPSPHSKSMDSELLISKFGRYHFYFGSQGMQTSTPLKEPLVPSEFNTLKHKYKKVGIRTVKSSKHEVVLNRTLHSCRKSLGSNHSYQDGIMDCVFEYT